MSEKFIHPPFKIGWHTFAFTLPPEWEVTSYVLQEEDGAMSFADESGALGQMSWRKVKAVPDHARIMSEVYRRYIKEADPARYKDFKELKFISANEVTMGYDKKNARFYASSFLEKPMLLVEWTFPEYSKRKADLVMPMLESFHPNEPVDGKKFYAAFGLEVNIPEGFKLETISALPACITMTFENKKYHKITARRWGMPEILFEGSDVKDFYHRFLYNHCRYVIKDVFSAEFFGKPGAEIFFQTRGKFGFDFLLGPWWRGKATVYHDTKEMRVYAIEHHAPRWAKERLTVKDLLGEKN